MKFAPKGEFPYRRPLTGYRPGDATHHRQAGRPDPYDYTYGELDPRYIEALNEWVRHDPLP